jgi:hypothetical protein
MPRLNLDELLAAVEDAPPVDAADVVGERLAATIGATGVSFLIADFSGQALIRLDHNCEPGCVRRAARPPSRCRWRERPRAARSRASASRSWARSSLPR